jgi:serine/threonine protein kinase/Tol biopolymer transport system component
MTREQHKRAGDLFDRIRELPASQQDAALDELCGSDVDLRARVQRLLKADQNAAGEEFLARPVMEEAAQMIELPAPGTVVGNYRLGHQIGAGGMGVVYEAEDLRLNRRVAVKILPSSYSEERIQRFQREARAAAQLNHPHIAAIYDAGQDQGCHYIAMELVEGSTLRDRMARETLDSARILDVLGQVASALSAAHAAGIIHRDIKPENIMLRPDGFVKVLDFGLARVREQDEPGLKTQPGQMAGTVHYFSPEQVLGKPVTPQSDLFSLGVVAYEMATGARPFQGSADGAVFDAILHAEAAPPSEIRPALGRQFDDLVQHALEKDPELRYQTASDFRSSCLRLGRHSSLQHAVPRRRVSKSRISIVAAVALIVTGGALTAWWLLWVAAEPRVTQVVQITRGALPVSRFANDGARIYFAAGPENASRKMFEVGTDGGEPVRMPQLDGMLPLDISPDRTQLLLLGPDKNEKSFGAFALWVTPALGSAPRRLGDVKAQFARWSPQGDRILYSEEGSLKLASSDGSDSGEIARVNGYIEDGAWSPDGKRVRFAVSLPNSRRIWEVHADGSDLHPVSFRGWDQTWMEMGQWTADGKYYVFSAGSYLHNLWMVRDVRWAVPFRLTNGPLLDLRPQPSPDGHRVYFVGSSNSGQLVRFNGTDGHWEPFLGGMDAVQVAYSRDGHWITFADSKGCLWRSAADGSDRRQLTAPPLFARNPRWSPDGQNIVFHGSPPGQPDSIYVAAAAGSSLTRLTQGEKGHGDGDGNWSPDGSVLLYSSQSYLYKVELGTRRVEQIPNSFRLWSPRWSPDGKLVAALDENAHLRLYNMATHQAAVLTSFAVGYPDWSRDGQYIYFENPTSTAWYRVGLAARKVELMQKLPTLETTLNSAGWVGMTPDGQIISARTVTSSNLYALELENR